MKCPLLIDDGKSVYCKCDNIIGGGGGEILAKPQKIIVKYAYGMDKAILDLYLNTHQEELHAPHNYLSEFKEDIIREINSKIREDFATSAKISFYFDMKMQKLMEDGSCKFDDSQIKGGPFHINPQNHGLTEQIMDSAIDDIHKNMSTRKLKVVVGHLIE